MPKIVDHDLYRKELLGKCFDLFAQKGYGSITMRQIAQGLGVSTGTLYHYFPSKQTLFEQLVQEINQQEMLMAIAELSGAKTLQEKMEALGRYLSKNEDYYIKLTYVLVDFCQHQDSKQPWSSGVFKLVDDQSRQALKDVLGIQDPALASFILSLIDGLILERLWGNENIDFYEQCALLGKMLTVYLSNKEINCQSSSRE
ncbi:TetR/AcrR family transcriptional regulator [Komarekiella sp. 'clone 1']|uniref:TetR/AcrR family transcriptional regulator n=1 Tax=Komarekiella delphini-convector SJRDD-AB1 TaxID=2593771 RepID=A0AA40ST50_9NOST|nr:TetR/AcrR family transcriptional regulator [Komarekiella delphini-convector]MBD6614780.1 TetR/AcrR family transcriptional regulator [Komarekiella delphini-convector SJRDD-AB1]